MLPFSIGSYNKLREPKQPVNKEDSKMADKRILTDEEINEVSGGAGKTSLGYTFLSYNNLINSKHPINQLISKIVK